jgi:antitoxin component YwqK of YwqJK toxin-antitoxin module
LLTVACKNKLDFNNENWDDGSLKQIVKTIENRTYDKEKLLNTTYLILYFHKGVKDSSNYYKIEEFYDNGQLSRIENFKEKKLNGEVKGWFKDGKNALDANYVNGKKHGEYKSWFPDGKILEQFKYDMDSVIKKRTTTKCKFNSGFGGCSNVGFTPNYPFLSDG